MTDFVCFALHDFRRSECRREIGWRTELTSGGYAVPEVANAQAEIGLHKSLRPKVHQHKVDRMKLLLHVADSGDGLYVPVAQTDGFIRYGRQRLDPGLSAEGIVAIQLGYDFVYN